MIDTYTFLNLLAWTSNQISACLKDKNRRIVKIKTLFAFDLFCQGNKFKVKKMIFQGNKFKVEKIFLPLKWIQGKEDFGTRNEFKVKKIFLPGE